MKPVWFYTFVTVQVETKDLRSPDPQRLRWLRGVHLVLEGLWAHWGSGAVVQEENGSVLGLLFGLLGCLTHPCRTFSQGQSDSTDSAEGPDPDSESETVTTGSMLVLTGAFETSAGSWSGSPGHSPGESGLKNADKHKELNENNFTS